ncbi:MAG: ATP-binding protein, partial [Syntrophomonadaceae bacterium]|nr:ATP-binding protein [Syntrophomonadaceae bacterium]
MYINRTAEKTVMNISNTFPVLLLTGPRQVGKTTMLKKLAGDDRNYVSLDDPMVRELATTDPALFLQRYTPPLLIDEIQYAPQLLSYIKIIVDREGEKGRFWLTGSQMFHLMKGVSESLAGRVGIVNLLGLSYAESLGNRVHNEFVPDIEGLKIRNKEAATIDLKMVYGKIYKGGMPAVYVENDINMDIFFSSYVQTYLQRDIKDLTQVGDELAFFRFLCTVAARTAQEVNYSSLANDTGISEPTAKQWLSILVSSGIVYLLEPYFNNTLKRLIKRPKMYFMDTGLCAYLTKWTSAETLEAGAMSGAFFETWVVTEIIKSYYFQGKRPPLCYYRDKEQREIDLLIIKDQKVYPLEIKKSANPGRDAIKNFSVLRKTQLEIAGGGVICMYDDLIPIDTNYWFIPVKL